MSTLIVPTDYPTIQAAVNAASSGDSILVEAGIYDESVVVTTDNLNIEAVFSVTITGMDPNNVGMTILSNGCNVRNFIFANNFIAMLIEGNSTTVEFCYFMNNVQQGIQLDADDCEISQCKFIENGIFALDVAGDNNLIYNNGFLNHPYIAIFNSTNVLTNSTIEKNDIQNSEVGIFMSIQPSVNNKITGNMLTCETGIQLQSDFTLVENNVMRKCRRTAILVNSDNNNIISNQISESKNGMSIAQDSNNIQLNAIGSCSECGVTVLSNNNSLERNVITGCKMGIQMMGDDNRVSCNTMFDNDRNMMKPSC